MKKLLFFAALAALAACTRDDEPYNGGTRAADGAAARQLKVAVRTDTAWADTLRMGYGDQYQPADETY